MLVHKKLYTIAEYQTLQALPEYRDRIFELIDGDLIEKMPSFTPSKIGARFGRVIGNFVDEHDLGYVTGADGGYIMSEATGKIYIPDVGFISKSRLAQEPAREAPLPPDLAVEVKSPTDHPEEMRAKAAQYLAYGTRMVWLVFPDEGLIEVYAQGIPMRELKVDDLLDGGAVLPGFSVRVGDLLR